jgi:hypothetical protein
MAWWPLWRCAELADLAPMESGPGNNDSNKKGMCVEFINIRYKSTSLVYKKLQKRLEYVFK